MKHPTDVSLMFAPSTAEWAAEAHVKTVQSDLLSVRLHVVYRARN